MKVLQLISSGGPYGAEAVVRTLSAHLMALGCDTAVGVFVNSQEPHTEIAEAACRDKVPVQLFPCRGRVDFHALRSIRAYIRSKQIDVCHTHGYKADLYGLLACAGLPVIRVSTHHMHADEHKLTPALRAYCFLDKLAARRFDRIVAVSAPISNALKRWGVSDAQLLWIRNGVEMAPFHDAAPQFGLRSGKTIGFAGRIQRQKGVFELLAAARTLIPAHPDLRVLMAGEGFDWEEVEREIGSTELRNHVRLLGPLQSERMPGFYASIDVLALPSYNEGLPMTLLEGMATGCAVVASRVGAVPTVIDGETNGLLVNARDAAGLAAQLDGLLRDPERRARLAERGRKTVTESYSARAMANEYLAVYREASQQSQTRLLPADKCCQ